MTFIRERKLVDKPKTGVYGALKAEMYRETLGYIDGDEGSEKYNEELRKKEDKRKAGVKSRVAEWEKNASKAKL